VCGLWLGGLVLALVVLVALSLSWCGGRDGAGGPPARHCHAQSAAVQAAMAYHGQGETQALVRSRLACTPQITHSVRHPLPTSLGLARAAKLPAAHHADGSCVCYAPESPLVARRAHHTHPPLYQVWWQLSGVMWCDVGGRESSPSNLHVPPILVSHVRSVRCLAVE
jgi:hypothetical protein